jgi:hypothetical protein
VTVTGDWGDGFTPKTVSAFHAKPYEIANCATLKAVRHGAFRRTTSARMVAIVIMSSAGSRPQCRSNAKTNAVDVLTPFASGEPAVTSGRSSSRTSRPAAT